LSKTLSGDTGKNMVHSGFESMTAIHGVVPGFTPQPIAWGTCRPNPDTHFFLSAFRHFDDTMPSPDDFAARLAKLHQNSQSPTGKFGFHTTTYAGNLPQITEWESSRETFFSKSLRYALDLETRLQSGA
jgi:fructosamine-3-kinase